MTSQSSSGAAMYLLGTAIKPTLRHPASGEQKAHTSCFLPATPPHRRRLLARRRRRGAWPPRWPPCSSRWALRGLLYGEGRRLGSLTGPTAAGRPSGAAEGGVPVAPGSVFPPQRQPSSSLHPGVTPGLTRVNVLPLPRRRRAWVRKPSASRPRRRAFSRCACLPISFPSSPSPSCDAVLATLPPPRHNCTESAASRWLHVLTGKREDSLS